MTQDVENRRPDDGEYGEYYQTYTKLVDRTDIVPTMEDQITEFRSVLDSIDEDTSQIVHAPYSWTIRQAVGHLIDAERVFAYRALRFAAADETPLPGFEQNSYIDNLDYTQVLLSELVDELEQVRRSNIGLFKRLPAEAWNRSGTADGKSMSVRAAAFILVGHISHHLNIIKHRVA